MYACVCVCVGACTCVFLCFLCTNVLASSCEPGSPYMYMCAKTRRSVSSCNWRMLYIQMLEEPGRSNNKWPSHGRACKRILFAGPWQMTPVWQNEASIDYKPDLTTLTQQRIGSFGAWRGSCLHLRSHSLGCKLSARDWEEQILPKSQQGMVLHRFFKISRLRQGFGLRGPIYNDCGSMFFRPRCNISALHGAARF